jgi:hypothetical protein
MLWARLYIPIMIIRGSVCRAVCSCVVCKKELVGGSTPLQHDHLLRRRESEKCSERKRCMVLWCIEANMWRVAEWRKHV